MQKNENKNYDGLIKGLRIASVVFMVAMLIATVIILKKYNINIKNAAGLSEQLKAAIPGGELAIALFIIFFSIGKSFALVFPPAVIFVVSGLCFSNPLVAMLVNFIATCLSLVIPYYLGRFTGKGMVDTLKRRFKKIEKLDDFADKNDFMLVLIVKASGMLPCDISSLLFGSLNINFRKYFIASNLGMLLLNVAWTCLGSFGDVTNPLSYLIVLPVLFVAIVPMAIIKITEKKKANAEKPQE